MRISKRCQGVSPSMTLAITSKAKALIKEGKDVVNFGVGEPDFNTPIHIREAAKAAIDGGATRYTPAAGTPELKAAICKSFKERGLNYEAAQVVVSNGAKHSLFNAMQAILDEGDEVILPAPYWVTYPELIKLSGAVPVIVPTDENLMLDMDAMKASITEKTKAIVINNPSNPTGAVYSTELMKQVAELAIAHDLAVISDEIYDQLIYDGDAPVSIATLPGMQERTIVINGVSKTYAMTGWRIGWLAAPLPVAKAITALQSQCTSNPNAIAQVAAIEALTASQESVISMREAFKERRDYAVNRIKNMDGVSCPTPGGAFYIMLDVSDVYGKAYEGKKIESSMDFASTLLDEKLVATVPGIAFGADAFVRLSYAASMEDIQKGLDRIEKFVKAMQ